MIEDLPPKIVSTCLSAITPHEHYLLFPKLAKPVYVCAHDKAWRVHADLVRLAAA